MVAVPLRDARTRLHAAAPHRRAAVEAFDHLVGFLQTLFDVAARQRAWHPLEVAVREQLRRVRLHRLFGIDDERKRFVLDLDQLQGTIGDLRVDGRKNRDCFTLEPYGIVECVLAAAPDHHFRGVLVRHHRAHARHRFSLAGVDSRDTRVGPSAPQHAADEHPGNVDVARVLGAACHALDCVDVRRTLADDVQCPTWSPVLLSHGDSSTP